MTDYDSAPSEVGGALGKDSEMLKTVIESRTRPYIDLMNELSGTGIEKDLTLHRRHRERGGGGGRHEDAARVLLEDRR